MENKYINFGSRGGQRIIYQAVQMTKALADGRKIIWVTPRYVEELHSIAEIKGCAKRHKDDSLDAIAYLMMTSLTDKEKSDGTDIM